MGSTSSLGVRFIDSTRIISLDARRGSLLTMSSDSAVLQSLGGARDQLSTADVRRAAGRGAARCDHLWGVGPEVA